MPSEDELRSELETMSAALSRRAKKARELDDYYVGSNKPPEAITRAKVTTAYHSLMPVASAPWGSLVVDSVQDRLEVSGISDVNDEDAAKKVWELWQENEMDAGSGLAFNTALIAGRAFAIVWPDDNGKPTVTLESPEQVIVKYRRGSLNVREAALYEWREGDVVYANLYRPEGIYKFKKNEADPDSRGRGESGEWQRHEVADEEWPLPNPTGLVDVVELPVNRRLNPRAGQFGYARGEFEHCTGLLDRIDLLTFLGLVVAFWMGFPLRGVIGDKILRDDDGEIIPPFDANAAGIFQLENPKAQIAEYKAADRQNLSIYAELDQLAAVSKTPRHYFPIEGKMSNVGPEGVWALEGGLHAKVPKHKASLGGGCVEIMRLLGLMNDERVELSPRASLTWKDHQSRSMAERADAATKVKSLGLPWQMIAEIYLNWTQDQILKGESYAQGSAFDELLRAANEPAPAPNAVA